MTKLRTSRKYTDCDLIGAIIDRYSNIPYNIALDRHGIKPNTFYRRTTKDLNTLIEISEQKDAEILTRIKNDKNLMRKLFKMDEEYIKQQYLKIIGTQGQKHRLVEGTLKNQENIDALVYIALTTDNPILKSRNREKVISEIKKITSNFQEYLRSLKLSGMFNCTQKKGEKGSPLAVLKIFDKVYQEKTLEASLFDLTQKGHLHEWGDTFNAPNNYWKNPSNVEKAIYHSLTEENPELASSDRKEVIDAIKKMSGRLQDHLHSIGLYGLMISAFKKGEQDSPLAVLKIFNKVYQEKTQEASLFDKTQKIYLKTVKKNRIEISE